MFRQLSLERTLSGLQPKFSVTEVSSVIFVQVPKFHFYIPYSPTKLTFILVRPTKKKEEDGLTLDELLSKEGERV